MNYTLASEASKSLPSHFRIDGATGELCLQEKLDWEVQNSYEFSAVATDAGKTFYDD